MEDYTPLLHPVVHQVDNPSNQRGDIVLISTSLPNPGAVTLIDVTQLELPQFFVHGRSTIFTTVPIETSGALHREGCQFLRSYNLGLQFNNILKTLSVAVQTVRADCVIIVRDRFTLDTTPQFPLSMASVLYHPQSASTYPLYVCVMML